MTIRTTAQRWAALAAFTSLAAVQGHGGDEEFPPASIAGQPPSRSGADSYVQRHMASEHHIGAFDLGSFFSLHDLNRDGTLDRAEIEAIYGVHHSTSVKHSPDYEVHDEKANKIVKEVLRRLDKDGDGLITQREFISAGPDGLPAFEEFGKGVLGHHYDEESEYFVHHEEIYHNTPETQKDSAYTHQEDIDHFAHHEKLEQEEERRERFAEGLPTKEEDEARRKAAEAKGEKYISPYDAQMPKPDSPAAPQYAYESHAESGFAHQEGWQATEHVFRTPEGDKVVKTGPVEGSQEGDGKPAPVLPPPGGGPPLDEHFPRRVPGETEEGFKDRMTAYAQRKLAASEFARANPNLAAKPGIDPKTGEVVQAPGETAEEFLKRKARAQYATTKAKPAYVAPSKQDTRKSAPYKYPPIQNRLKKSSYFGEF